MTFRRIEIIAGPTASGKSALAVERAIKANGTVINADSMQIYDALPILTAQPVPDDLRAAPHCLYGLLPPDEPCSAALWRSLAMEAIERTLTEGRTPIVTGGTGFYIDSLISGLSPMPDVPAAARAAAMALQAACGNPGFHALLAESDRVMAARLHPNDTQRLIRAWEVLQATGMSLSDWQDKPREGPPEDWRFAVTLVLPDRAVLYDRCNRRFDHMMERGVLDEVATFAADRAIPPDAPIRNALGCPPLCAYLNGTISLEDAVIQARIDTRHYAKRQTTWFRHQVKPAQNIESISLERTVNQAG